VDSCGYFSTSGGPGQKHPGVVVVDASDRKHPQASTYLDSPAMLRPNEGLDAVKKVIGAIEVTTSGGTILPPATANLAASFDLYDATDCRKPVLRSSIKIPGFVAHAGRFAPDGRTFYTTSATYTGQPSEKDGFVAIDTSDVSNAK